MAWTLYGRLRDHTPPSDTLAKLDGSRHIEHLFTFTWRPKVCESEKMRRSGFDFEGVLTDVVCRQRKAQKRQIDTPDCQMSPLAAGAILTPPSSTEKLANPWAEGAVCVCVWWACFLPYNLKWPPTSLTRRAARRWGHFFPLFLKKFQYSCFCFL